MNRHFNPVASLAACLLASAAALLAAPAHAGLVTLETPPAMVYNHGEKFYDGGLAFTAQISAFAQSQGLSEGMGGEIFDGSNPNSCGAVLDCPSGNASQYYAGLNDGSVKVQREGGFYSLRALRFAFIVPAGGATDGVYGQLVLNATLLDGSTVSRAADFAAQDGNGQFMFATWNLDTGFASLALRDLSISACMFDGLGACLNPAEFAFNQSQFAIDDLDVALPLPASAPLMLLGLAALALSRRRAHSTAQ